MRRLAHLSFSLFVIIITSRCHSSYRLHRYQGWAWYSGRWWRGWQWWSRSWSCWLPNPTFNSILDYKDVIITFLVAWRLLGCVFEDFFVLKHFHLIQRGCIGKIKFSVDGKTHLLIHSAQGSTWYSFLVSKVFPEEFVLRNMGLFISNKHDTVAGGSVHTMHK